MADAPKAELSTTLNLVLRMMAEHGVVVLDQWKYFKQKQNYSEEYKLYIS